MAKDRRKLQHIHSSIPDKQPTATSLEVGEIAVNNAKDQEFLSIKNSDNKVVRFSSDEQVMSLVEKKEVMPYKGYVRGETGPSSTEGDSPTADANGSYGITTNDLLNNKSNIIIKLNQVAASNTVKHNKVNGAKDIYNKLINPTSDNGLTDGAGFSIDMSRYAMQGANPSFSSITNTCRTTLNGTTIIKGLNGDCGSLFDVNVNNANANITNANTVLGTVNTVISGNTTLRVDGTTTETRVGNVVENHNGTTTENNNGALIINNQNGMTENTTGDTCIVATNNVNIAGDINTRIGGNCNGSPHSDSTTIYGTSNVTINSPKTIITGETYLSGVTYIANKCSAFSSSTIADSFCETLNRSKITMTKDSNPSDVNLSAIYKIYQDNAQVGSDINIPKGTNLRVEYDDVNGKSDYTISSSGGTIYVPKSIEHLNEWDGSCLTIRGCVKATNFYQTSDRNAKENISHAQYMKILNANRVPVMQFNFKDDPSQRMTYGVIAQDVEGMQLDEVVYVDEQGKKSVDYTSLMMLKIAYLEEENRRLSSDLRFVLGKIKKLEEKD